MKWLLGLIAALSLGWASFARQGEFEVICCGRCRPGDDCLAKCEVRGTPPPGLRLTCCGRCQSGDDCAKRCAPGRQSCCQVR